MRINKARVGMEVVDKITGTLYRIESIDDPTKTSVTEAKGVEVLPEDSEKEPLEVTINGTNDITFRVEKWAPDEDIHDAEIIDDQLIIDGQPVETGYTGFKEILKKFPGLVIFSMEDENGTIKVMSFSPYRNKFIAFGSIPADVKVLDDSDTRVIYGYSLNKEVEEEDEQGNKVIKEVFDHAGIAVLTKTGLKTYDTAATAYDDYDENDYDEDEDYYEDEYESSDSSILNGFDLDHVVLAQGEKYLYVPLIPGEDDKEISYVVLRVTNHPTYQYMTQMPGLITAVTSNRSSDRSVSVVCSGEKFVKVGDVVFKSDLAGYIYLVDVRVKDDITTYIFSTEDRQLKTVSRKVTEDRGIIESIVA